MKCDPDSVADERWRAINDYFMAEMKPLKFNPYERDNVLMSGEMMFEEICSTMEDNGVQRVKELTEFEFYTRLKYLEKKFKAKNHVTSQH
jgi:hypothetical protein